MFFTNQKEVKHIRDNMFAYLFGYGGRMIVKAAEIADYLRQNTENCSEEIKKRANKIIYRMYDIIGEIGDLGRSYGLCSENSYVILDMSDGMEYSFKLKDGHFVESISIDYMSYYSKILTKEEILAKIINREDFTRL